MKITEPSASQLRAIAEMVSRVCERDDPQSMSGFIDGARERFHQHALAMIQIRTLQDIYDLSFADAATLLKIGSAEYNHFLDGGIQNSLERIADAFEKPTRE
jgi:hypothetical protein